MYGGPCTSGPCIYLTTEGTTEVVMSIWSSIIDMLLFFSRYLINSTMIKFIQNQGHIKIIVFNLHIYEQFKLMPCVTISVLSITIYISHIQQRVFLWRILTTCTLARTQHSTGDDQKGISPNCLSDETGTHHPENCRLSQLAFPGLGEAFPISHAR